MRMRISGHCFNGQKFSFISEQSIVFERPLKLLLILSGERDTDPLVPNCQPVAKRASIKEEKKSSKAKFSNHALPSSMFSLSDEERLELKDVIVNMALVDIVFMMENKNKQ